MQILCVLTIAIGIVTILFQISSSPTSIGISDIAFGALIWYEEFYEKDV